MGQGSGIREKPVNFRPCPAERSGAGVPVTRDPKRTILAGWVGDRSWPRGWGCEGSASCVITARVRNQELTLPMRALFTSNARML